MAGKNKKLSIITICYNIKGEIERTCESIVNQTNQNFEWIVVDGGSTDGTVDVLNKYKDRIDVFISEPDNGIYNAMNKGIKQAHGEFLNFMNGGDCFADSNVVADFLNYDTDGVDILYGNCCIIDTSGKHALKKFPDKLNKLSFYNGLTINHQSTFIRHTLFNTYGLYNETYHLVSDWEKWLCFFVNKCTFKHWDKLVADFYYGGASDKQKALHDAEVQKICPQYFTNSDIASIPARQIKVSLLGLPLLQIINKYEQGVIRIKLLKVFPLYKVVIVNEKNYHYLFGFIPLFKTKGKSSD